MVWAVMGDTISTPSAYDDDVTSLTRVWSYQRGRLGHLQSGTHGHGSDDVRQPETSGWLGDAMGRPMSQPATTRKGRQAATQDDVRPSQASDHNTSVPLSQGVTRYARPCEVGDDDAGAGLARRPITRGDDGIDAWPATTTQGERTARLSHRRGGIRCRGHKSMSCRRRRRPSPPAPASPPSFSMSAAAASTLGHPRRRVPRQSSPHRDPS